MHILVIGGSGRVGKLVISQSLASGHHVTALLRNPSVNIQSDSLSVISGTPTNISDLQKAFDNNPDHPPQAVIVTLRSVRASDSPWAESITPPTMMADVASNLITVMRKQKIRKIVVLSAMGTADSFPNVFVAMRWAIKNTNLSICFTDHENVEELLKKSGLDFVLVKPTRLTAGPRTPVKTFGHDGKGIGGLTGVSRETVAAFLIGAVETAEWDGTIKAIAS